MPIHLRSLSRLGLLLAALLTLTLIFTNTHLPITQAENSTIEKAVPAQSGGVAIQATVGCAGANLQITITAGTPPFRLTGQGPNLPADFPSLGTFTVDGAGLSAWGFPTLASLTDGRTLNFGSAVCSTGVNYVPLVFTMECVGLEAVVNFISGDLPFHVVYNNYSTTVTGLGIGSYTLADTNTGTPNLYYGISVYEDSGDYEGFGYGGLDCRPNPTPVHLNTMLYCYGDWAEIRIFSGDPLYTLTGVGPGLPRTINPNSGNGSIDFNLFGPATWQNIQVSEGSGDHEVVTLGDITCPGIQLNATAQCVGPNLEINVIAGDLPLNITGNGPELPQSNVGAGTLVLHGPATWSNIDITEPAGNHENIHTLDFTCASPPPQPLTARVGCVSEDLLIDVISGDYPFYVQGNGAGLPRTLGGLGTQSFQGPSTWTSLILTEQGGDGEQVALPDITCPQTSPTNPLVVTYGCTGNDGWVQVESGDPSLYLEGTATPLPISITLGTPFTLMGPGTWSDLVVRELGGDLESFAVPSFSCAIPANNLVATMTCDNDDLVVDIQSGDPFFAIIGTGPGLPLAVQTTGVYRFPGPAIWTDLNVHEPVGNPIERINFGTIACPPPIPPEPPVLPPAPPVILPAYVPARVMEISAGQQHMVYDRPGGEPIHNADSSLLLLPHDADGSGSDTFIVLDAQIYEGEVWLGIYLGGPNLGWLPQADLYPAD